MCIVMCIDVRIHVMYVCIVCTEILRDLYFAKASLKRFSQFIVADHQVEYIP